MSQRSLPPATGAPSASSLTRRTLLAATVAAVPAGAVMLGASPALADPSVSDGETRIVDVPLAEVPLIDVEGIATRDLAEQPATMAGVTWPTDIDAPEVHVRGLDAEGEWTEWLLLESAEDPETGEAVAGTEVGWIGVVSALQIRAGLDGADATEQLIAHIVTTSPTPADEQVAPLSATDAYSTGTTSTEPQPQQMRMMAASVPTNPATPTLVAAPSFTSRSAWGADESRVRSTRGIDQLKAVVIHHTAGTNNYSSSESAQIIRGIQRYHTVTLGWADIGYNMVVSKYGQVFEGRGGGLHRNIVGAHAYGFNTGSFGISVMGDYSNSAPPRAARVAVAQLVGWKLLSTFQTSVWAKSSWTPGSGTRYTEGKTISLAKMMGHRDVNFTECPGWSFYTGFDAIRGEAQAFIDGGWKKHLKAFTAEGGADALGTVVKSAHMVLAPERDREYSTTVLTEGLIIDQGGRASAYVSPMATQWQGRWGRPRGGPEDEGDRIVQAFSFGMGVQEDGKTRFVEPTLEDVRPGRSYYVDIYDLVAAGVVNGYGGTEYRGNEVMRRDHMLAFIYRAAGSPAFTPPRTSPFADVPTNHDFYTPITWAYENGITIGWKADRTFRPLESVRRDHLASFLWRAAGMPDASPADADQFSDIPRTNGYATEIGWLAKAGISRGYSDGTYRPLVLVERDQMAAFMVRWMRALGRL